MSTDEVQLDLSYARRLAAWEEFHAENPHVYELFERFAFEAIRSGMSRYGAHGIVERIRWHVSIDIRSTDGLKINDHHAPFMSRLFVERHPEHAGFFELRERFERPRLSKRAQ